MSIYAEWGNPQQTILHVYHREQWTWDELRQHDAAVTLKQIAAARGTVALLIDLRGSHWLQPEQFNSQMRAALQRYQHPAVACVLFITSDPLTASLLDALLAHDTTPHLPPAYVVESVEAAYQFAQHPADGQIA